MLVNRNPEYFLTIVREGSISRAAEKLFISQSSLSQHVAKLEEGLDVRLFDRSQSPISLTPAGRLYRNYLESNTYLYQKFQADLTDLNFSRSQTVHLGMGNWRGSLLTPGILPGFLGEHPQARVHLHEFPVSELYAMMEDGKVDFSVMNTSPAGVPDSFVNEIIAYERILLVIHKENPIAREFSRMQAESGTVDLHRLEAERLISLSNTLTVGRHVGNFLQKNRLNFANLLSSTNNATVLRLVAAGLGFCFLVETGLQDAARYPELVFFDLQSPELSIPLSLVSKNNGYLSPLARDLMDMIREHYHAVIRGYAAMPKGEGHTLYK